MALLFDADGENVDCGDPAVLQDLTTFTICVWMKPLSGQNLASRIVSKGQEEFFNNSFNSTMEIIRTRGTVTARALAPNANFAHHAFDTWMFVVGQIDTSTAANCRLLIGNLTNLAAEPSAYTTQTNGSGTTPSDVGDSVFIGNNVSGARASNAAIAYVAYYNRILSIAEIQAQQFRPRPITGCVGFWVPGFNASVVVGDWSGNGNTGTVTNATLADHVPLPFRRARPQYIPYAVTADARKRFLLTRF
jgi:concanavalin A-like lectin/glucanase superfamily protein